MELLKYKWNSTGQRIRFHSLSNIYINDLPDVVKSMVKLFAHDTKLYSVVNNQQEAEELQTDLANIGMWSEKWQLNFNIGKCKNMHIGKINENEQRESYMTKIIRDVA